MNSINKPSARAIGTVKDSFQAFLVEHAHFTRIEEYPILQPEMISKVLPLTIMPFSKAINYHGDLTRTFICTYSPDDSFERIRRDPRKYVHFFQRTAGIIGFDFSVHSDMPVIKQKSQMNDNLALTYYYGSNGIPVIPNLRCGINELLPEYLSAIPKKELVAVGTHGFCTKAEEKCEWYCFLETIISELEPSAIIVYGSLNGKMFAPLIKEKEFIFYEPWITQRRKEAKNVY